jgi:arginine utilization protein RocB
VNNQSIDIKNFIESIISAQKKAKKIIEHQINSEYDDSKIISFFSLIEKESLYANSSVAEKVADYLQLMNDELNYKNVDLQDIKSIYENIIDMNPYDITFYESLGWYLHNVLDQEEEAKKVVNKGIMIINSKIADLKKQF